MFSAFTNSLLGCSSIPCHHKLDGSRIDTFTLQMSDSPGPPAESDADADVDPTYTHFTHRDEFRRLLDQFLDRSVLDQEFHQPDQADKESKLVEQMGGIVRHFTAESHV